MQVATSGLDANFGALRAVRGGGGWCLGGQQWVS